MSSSDGEEEIVEEVQVIHKVESFCSEEPPMDEWSSLNAEIPDVNVKHIRYEQGLYRPGSGEICAKYIPLSASSVLRHPYYNYPSVLDPGIKEALLNPLPKIIYSDDGQELYLESCKETGVCPIRSFYRQLLESNVDLKYYGIPPMGFRPIAMSLNNNRIVKELDLTDNWISEDGCYHLGEMFVSNITLEELNLHGCRIGPEGARHLFINLHANPTLRKLNLTKNCLGDAGVEHLANAISSGADVADINLSHNSLTAKAIEALTTAFQTNNNLTHLNLSWNTIFSPNAIYSLCSKLSKNAKFQEIDLSWNSLAGPRIANAIRLVMKAKNIKSIYLNNNKLSTEVNRIARNIANSKLTTLDLSYNPISPDTALFLLSYLKIRKVKLQNLFLDNVIVSNEFMDLKGKILELQFRLNAVITCGPVLSKFVARSADMREIVMKRAEFLCSKSKKGKVDIALAFLAVAKTAEGPMEAKELSIALKKHGANALDDDLVDEIVNSFPGPTKQKVKFVDFDLLVDYIHRKWPGKKLPPTPPPEPETGPRGKKSGKRKI